MPSRVLKFQIPRHVLITSYPRIQSFSSDLPLKVFGCSSFVHIQHNHHSKLDPKSFKCIFLGYSSNKKGYNCYFPITGRVYNSMDVTFFENQSYYPKSAIQGENSREYQIWDLLQDTQANLNPPNSPYSHVPTNVTMPETAQITHGSTPEIEPIISSNPSQLGINNPELRVYRRRRPAEHLEETMQNQHSQSQEPSPTESDEHNGMNFSSYETHVPMVDDLNLPIALRKGVRGCTEHPIGKYVAYGKLLPSYKPG